MIPAMVDTQAPPPARGPITRVAGKDREAPAFDDAMREQERGVDSDKDDALASADAPPVVAAAPPPPAPAPLAALEALIAQVMPQQAPAREAAPTPTTTEKADAESVAMQTIAAADPQAAALGQAAPRRSAAAAAHRSAADDPALDVAVDGAPETDESRPHKTMPQQAQDAPGKAFRLARDQAAANDTPAPAHGASAFTPSADAPAHERRVEADDGAAPKLRNVAVGKVSTATHFPVTNDPVRQIATAVTRALDAPSPTLPAEAPAQPIKTVNVQLEPESLGTVTLRMRLSGSQLSVRVDVAEPATLEMIQRDRDRLQKTMASDSVTIDRLDIVAARDVAPVQAGDNANAPRQDTNASGQQSSRQHQASPQNGDSRGGQRGQQPQGQDQIRRTSQDNDSHRSGDSRHLYL